MTELVLVIVGAVLVVRRLAQVFTEGYFPGLAFEMWAICALIALLVR